MSTPVIGLPAPCPVPLDGPGRQPLRPLGGDATRVLLAPSGSARYADLDSAASTRALAGADPGLVAAYLSAEHGVGVRDGRCCALRLLARLGVPDGALRAGVGVGSTLEDVDRLVAAVGAFCAAGPGLTCSPVAGRWQPVDDPRRPHAAPDAEARAAGCGRDVR